MKSPSRVSRSALVGGAGWVVLVGAVVHPAHGMGLALCGYQQMFRVECPGCGLTRSVSCAARGMWHDSASYHPLGALVLAAAAVMAIWPFLPRTWRSGASAWASRRRWLAPALTLALAWALVGVTVWRLAW